MCHPPPFRKADERSEGTASAARGRQRQSAPSLRYHLRITAALENKVAGTKIHPHIQGIAIDLGAKNHT
jgi:hypothetical protein